MFSCSSNPAVSKKFSIIIPHYNDVERLQRLLKSIPLHREDVQTIIIDDCSTEQQALTILRETLHNIVWLSTRTKSNAGHARNIGLNHATGEFIIFADADDEFTENAFSIIERSLGNCYDLCYFLAESVQEHDMSRSVRADPFNRLCLKYLKRKSVRNFNILRAKHVIPCAKIYRRETLEALNIRFDETNVSNDVAFNVLAAFEMDRIQVIPEYVYRIYRRQGSLTASQNKETFLERFYVSVSLAERLKKAKVQYRPSAIGSVLKSMRFGLKTFIDVLRTSISSDLRIYDYRMLNPIEWLEAIKYSHSLRRELTNLQKKRPK